jgi:protein-S-isoprenylcysteine O-methyltransferase Ste14
MVLIQAAILFISAGKITWPDGWLYIGLYIALLVIGAIIIVPNNRDVIEERSKGLKGGKKTDLAITKLLILPSFSLLLIAGLDERWSWSAGFNNAVKIAGIALFILGYIIVLWAMSVNKYFSQIVRIQRERGHTTITDGPYKLIRHPGYAGMILSFTGSVLILGSLYGLICLLGYVALVIARTSYEDKTLINELDGYKEYSLKTKYRILWGVW